MLKHEKMMENLCEKVRNSVVDDVERKTLKYYLEYEKCRKLNRYRCYIYFLKNILKIQKRMLSQIIINKL